MKVISGVMLIFLLLSMMIVTLELHVGIASATFGEIVATFDAPGDSQHGLAWDGEYLWMSASSLVGSPQHWKLYKIHPLNASVVKEFNISYQTCGLMLGLEYVDGYLWGCSIYSPEHNHSNIMFKYSLNGSFVAGPYDLPYGAPQGLAYDGTYLWVAYNTADDEITATTLPPNADTYVFKFYAPSTTPSGLAWLNGYLWLSASSTIYQIDPSNGEVVRSFTDTNHFSYASGITFDGSGYLWVVDNDKDRLYKVNVKVETFPMWYVGIGVIVIGVAVAGVILWRRRKESTPIN